MPTMHEFIIALVCSTGMNACMSVEPLPTFKLPLYYSSHEACVNTIRDSLSLVIADAARITNTDVGEVTITVRCKKYIGA